MPVIKGIIRLPLLVLSLSFILGIFLGSLTALTAAFWLWLAGAVLLLGVTAPGIFRWLAANRPGVIRALFNRLPLRFAQNLGRELIQPRQPGGLAVSAIVVLCLLGMALGAARYKFAILQTTPLDAAWYNDAEDPVEVVGVVVRPPDQRDGYTQVVIEVERIEGIEVSGKALLYLPPEDWRYGDRLRVFGALQTPPEDEDFSYQDYLARKGIYSYMPFASARTLERGLGNWFLSKIYAFKHIGLDLIYSYIPDPEASLLAGIVLGVESGIPDDVDQAFKDTGTTHVIAISGFNITIVASLFAILFGRLMGPRRGAVTALVAISIYTLLVGGDAAVVRAAIMGGLSLFARQVGRRQHGLNSLGITAALMAVFNPHILWDVGFQLSFAATLGLIVYAQPWEERLRAWLTNRFSARTARAWTGPVSEYLLLTLAAQLATFPLIVYHFGRLSLVSLPANVAILPAQPPVMALGGLAVLLGAIWQPVGQVLAYAVWPFLAYSIRMVEWFARWDDGVRVLGPVRLWAVIAFYLVLLILTVFWEPIMEKVKISIRPVLILGALLVAVVLVWQAVLSRPDGQLHLTLLEVGNGEAALIQTPDGRFVLVGGGESANSLSAGLGRNMPLFHRQLDVLVVAGTKAEQLEALPAVVPRYPPESVWWAGDPAESRPSRQLHAWLALEHIPLEEMRPGQSLNLGQGAALDVLAASGDGAVLLLYWDDFRVLLPIGGDPGLLTTPQVTATSQNLTALLLSRNGRADYNPEDWLAGIRPELILLSVDPLNRAGLPDPEVLAAISGIPLLRTDQNGVIELVTDGDQLWIYAEK